MMGRGEGCWPIQTKCNVVFQIGLGMPLLLQKVSGVLNFFVQCHSPQKYALLKFLFGSCNFYQLKVVPLEPLVHLHHSSSYPLLHCCHYSPFQFPVISTLIYLFTAFALSEGTTHWSSDLPFLPPSIQQHVANSVLKNVQATGFVIPQNSVSLKNMFSWRSDICIK